VFVLAGEAEPMVFALRDFDRAARGRQCGDVKARAEVWTERNLYLPTGGQRPQDSARPALLPPSTYRLGGIAYVALGEPGARTGDSRRGRSCISTTSDTFC
jgi:hypothetical protein